MHTALFLETPIWHTMYSTGSIYKERFVTFLCSGWRCGTCFQSWRSIGLKRYQSINKVLYSVKLLCLMPILGFTRMAENYKLENLTIMPGVTWNKLTTCSKLFLVSTCLAYHTDILTAHHILLPNKRGEERFCYEPKEHL